MAEGYKDAAKIARERTYTWAFRRTMTAVMAAATAAAGLAAAAREAATVAAGLAAAAMAAAARGEAGSVAVPDSPR